MDLVAVSKEELHRMDVMKQLQEKRVGNLAANRV